jgi:hypothetical protein
MKPRTIALDTPLFKLSKEILHTLAMVMAYPFLITQIALVEPFMQSWLQFVQSEMVRKLASLKAEMRIIVVDDKLDLLCVAIAATLLAECGNDRTHPEYLRYFKNIRPSDLRRPILGKQLEVMRTWVPSLMDSSQALRDLGTQLAEVVAEADDAVTARLEAGRMQADFDLRSRKPFVDELNAMRLALYGQLAEMPHKYVDRKLPKTFANRFFLRSSNHNQRSETIAEVEADILRLRETLAERENQLQVLLDEQDREERMRENVEYEAAERALAEAAQVHAEAEASLEAIRARMGRNDDSDDE